MSNVTSETVRITDTGNGLVISPLNESNISLDEKACEVGEQPSGHIEIKEEIPYICIESLVSRAVIMATLWHKEQKRKDGVTDYITHPLAVAALTQLFDYAVEQMTADEVYAATCLHDVLEDCDVTAEYMYQLFPKVVVDTVVELTNDPKEIKKLGKLRYQQQKLVDMSDGAFYIKLCDRLHNISCSPTQEYCEDTIRLINYVWQQRNIRRMLIPLMAKILETAGRKMKYVPDENKLSIFL